MDKQLHLVAINIPWPPNYGGIIDIYYKIKALRRQGAGVILHCFEYGRPRADELEEVCEEVYYYRRRTGLRTNITTLPYNVYSRKNERLIGNLLKDGSPILFEGLHTCYYLNDKRLDGRFKIFRESNVEHDYYREIGKAESDPVKKCFYYIEALRFKKYQPRLSGASLMLTVSHTDTDYFRHAFPDKRVEYLPSFHGNGEVTSLVGQSDFLLYHGKLSVKENEKAALYLIRHVFSRMTPFRCVIAGMNPSAALLKAAAPYAHITVEANPSPARMDELLRTAHVNLLVTFQSTGLKLKLLNSLFAGRHVVVNPSMLAGSGLEALCRIAATPEEMIAACRSLMHTPFSAASLEARRALLVPAFSDDHLAQKLLRMIPWKEDRPCGRTSGL